MKSIHEKLVESGPYMDLSWLQHKVAYRNDEKTRIPYPGLEEFKKIRENRDYSFGKGLNMTKTDDVAEK